MRRIITVHLILRVIPLALFGVLMLLEYSTGAPEGVELRRCCYLIAVAVLYLAHPLSREDTANSVRFCVLGTVYYVCAFLLERGLGLEPFFYLLPSAAFILIYLVGGLLFKYKEPAAIFRKDAAWCCAEEDSRTFYSIIVLAFVILLTVCRYEAVPGVVYNVVAVLLLLTDVMLYVRAYSGRTELLGRNKERRIQTIMLTNGRMSDIVPEIENTILAKAYRRIEQFMRDNKPYLDDRFSLDKMSDYLKLNKVYISRAVNKFTNKNFRQYVNWHRVLYSMELMKGDPWLKVIELAFMSGFHSQVTYNMCFKLFMDETPSDVLARLRMSKPRPSNANIEVKLPRDEVLPSSRDA